MNLAYVVGARPNFVKMAPVISALRRRQPGWHHAIIHTGQHYDASMSEIFFSDLGVPAPDHLLDVGSGSHGKQTARAMELLEPVLEEEGPDLVLVPGDVNSTLAATLVAAKLQMPLAHVESGLRSFDRTMPEEINRIVADEFADLLFVHSDEAVDNLLVEGIDRSRIHFVGNTMIDSLRVMEPRFRALHASVTFGLNPGTYILVTLHRPALVDGPLLKVVIAELNELSRKIPVVFPVHPRTRQNMRGLKTADDLVLLDPLGYLEFLSLQADAKAVLTDSGGIQEESTCLGIPCFTLRGNTERPVTVRLGTNVLLGLDPSRIREIPDRLQETDHAPECPPLWDGMAAQRVADAVERFASLREGVGVKRREPS